jgi:hypothetical protein
MRKSIDTYVKAIAHDNEQEIRENYMTVADYIINDAENCIVLRFENHRFNDTVRCTPLLADGREPTAIRELADWLRESHYDKIF